MAHHRALHGVVAGDVVSVPILAGRVHWVCPARGAMEFERQSIDNSINVSAFKAVAGDWNRVNTWPRLVGGITNVHTRAGPRAADVVAVHRGGLSRCDKEFPVPHVAVVDVFARNTVAQELGLWLRDRLAAGHGISRAKR